MPPVDHGNVLPKRCLQINMIMRTQTAKKNSNELNTIAIREAIPYGSRRTANIDAQNAIGAVTSIMLGPSHMSG